MGGVVLIQRRMALIAIRWSYVRRDLSAKPLGCWANNRSSSPNLASVMRTHSIKR